MNNINEVSIRVGKDQITYKVKSVEDISGNPEKIKITTDCGRIITVDKNTDFSQPLDFTNYYLVASGQEG